MRHLNYKKVQLFTVLFLSKPPVAVKHSTLSRIVEMPSYHVRNWAVWHIFTISVNKIIDWQPDDECQVKFPTHHMPFTLTIGGTRVIQIVVKKSVTTPIDCVISLYIILHHQDFFNWNFRTKFGNKTTKMKMTWFFFRKENI